MHTTTTKSKADLYRMLAEAVRNTQSLVVEAVGIKPPKPERKRRKAKAAVKAKGSSNGTKATSSIRGKRTERGT